MFLIIGSTLGTSIMVPPGVSIKHDAWIVTIVGMVVGLFFAIIYATLANRFPGKTLIEFNDIIYGRYLGKVISATFIWYFIHSASIILREIGDFSLVILPETPILLFIVAIILVCGSAVRNGIEVIVRCCYILMILNIFLFAIVSILLLKDMKFINLLPIIEISIMEFIESTFTVSILPFTQTVVFLMIFPFLNNQQEIKSAILKAVFFSGVILTISAIQNITVLGASMPISMYPNFETVRLIKIGKILTRLEIIAASSLLSFIFIKVCVFLYGTVLGMAQLLKLRTCTALISPISIFIVILSILLFENALQVFQFLSEIWPYFVMIFQFIFPPLSLVIAKIRGLPQ